MQKQEDRYDSELMKSRKNVLFSKGVRTGKNDKEQQQGNNEDIFWSKKTKNKKDE